MVQIQDLLKLPISQFLNRGFLKAQKYTSYVITISNITKFLKCIVLPDVLIKFFQLTKLFGMDQV